MIIDESFSKWLEDRRHLAGEARKRQVEENRRLRDEYEKLIREKALLDALGVIGCDIRSMQADIKCENYKSALKIAQRIVATLEGMV